MRSNACWSWLCAATLIGCGGASTPASSPASNSEPLPSLESAATPAEASNGPEVDRAIAAIKAADYASAKAALEQALRKNPKNGVAAYYMGVALENTGDKTGAETRYREALANAPGLAEAAINLGALYLDQSRWDDAIAVSERALAQRSDDPALHANMAVALRGKGDPQRAAAEYERAIKVAGDNAELRFAYGSMLVELGNKPKAIEQLRAALAKASGQRALLASIGRMLGAAGAFGDCVSALDQAVALGDDAELRVRRGLCRHSLRDEAGARSDFETATKLDPKFAPAHYYLGEALIGAGNHAQALKEFDAAASAGPQTDLGKKAKSRADGLRHAGPGAKAAR
jgi:tetratricopeptide (TPR) repeat protein